MTGNGWIDISVALHDGMVHWPGDPPVEIRRVLDLKLGDACNLTALSMCAHTGTHMDAPLHHVAGAGSIDAMPLEATVGRARVIPIGNEVSIEPAELERWQIRPDERILFKTRNSLGCWNSDEFVEDFVYISEAAAAYLARIGVRSVGVDYLSVGRPGPEGVRTHQRLLEAGIWLIEGLDLSAVEPGEYELVCLPLRIAGADGAPARALLRPIAGS